ncbi:kinesin-like nuclear fusion protein, partial [Lunasporangiospora selenospora]
MDPLKRSASKLKPPSTFARTNSSSELSTVMALAAAYNKTDNTLTSAHGSAGSAALATPTPHAIADRHLLTLEMLDVPAKPISGMKRKAEEISRDRRPQPQPARPQALAPRGIANTRRNVASTTPSTLVSKTPQLSSNVGKPIRPPPRQPSAVTTAPRSGPVTVSSRPSPATAPRGNTSRPVAAPTKGNSRAPMPVARKGPMPASTLPGSKTVGGPGNKANESKEKEVQDLAAESPMSSTELLSALEFPKKKKRAAWDTKNRLQDMEEITGALHGLLSKSVNSMNGMTNKLELNESKIMELENFRENLEGKVADKESEYHVICQKMSVAQSDLQVTARKNADEIQSLRTQLSLEKEHMHLLEAQIQQGLDGTNSKLRLATAQLDHQMEENAALRGTISTQSSLRLAFESDNRVLKMKIEQTEGTLASREKALGSLEHELVDTEAIVMDLEQKIRGDEAVRRKLYHSIMDLKGNVRVYARVRPLTPEISMSTPITTFIFPDQEGHELEITSPLPSRLGSSILGISRIRGLQLPATTSTGVSKKTYPFKFDKVFGPQSAQQDIYEEIQPLVQSALDGANTCVFMYGQKGSGKTHTLVGSEGKYDAEAVLPQAILELLQATKDLEAKSGCSTTVEARFFRIHDQGLGGDVETIHDMLASPGRASIEPSEAIEIGIGQNGKAEITGATVMRLSSIRDSEALLKAATTPCSGSSDMKEGAQRQCRNCH